MPFYIELLEHLSVAVCAKSTSKAKLNTEAQWHMHLLGCVEVIIDGLISELCNAGLSTSSMRMVILKT